MFRKKGADKGELNLPHGIAVDAGGLVYVSEYSHCCVSVFTSEGGFVTSFGREGSGPGEFRKPHGLTVDDCGVVYVCDHTNDLVQLF